MGLEEIEEGGDGAGAEERVGVEEEDVVGVAIGFEMAEGEVVGVGEAEVLGGFDEGDGVFAKSVMELGGFVRGRGGVIDDENLIGVGIELGDERGEAVAQEGGGLVVDDDDGDAAIDHGVPPTPLPA